MDEQGTSNGRRNVSNIVQLSDRTFWVRLENVEQQLGGFFFFIYFNALLAIEFSNFNLFIC